MTAPATLSDLDRAREQCARYAEQIAAGKSEQHRKRLRRQWWAGFHHQPDRYATNKNAVAKPYRQAHADGAQARLDSEAARTQGVL